MSQTPLLLASNGPAQFALAQTAQLDLGFQRSGFAGGSDTLLATAPSRATPLDPGPGGDVERSDTGFIQDLLFQLNRGFWQSSTEGGGPTQPQPPATQQPMPQPPQPPNRPGGKADGEALDRVFAEPALALLLERGVSGRLLLWTEPVEQGLAEPHQSPLAAIGVSAALAVAGSRSALSERDESGRRRRSKRPCPPLAG